MLRRAGRHCQVKPVPRVMACSPMPRCRIPYLEQKRSHSRSPSARTLTNDPWPLTTIHYPLSTIHYPLSTIHYPLHCRKPVPPSPARVSETCYTARSSPNTSALDPNTLPPHTLPPAMSTGSALKVRILPPADIASGPVGNNRQCAYLPSFAQSKRSDAKRSMKPLPAHPAPGSESCHEEHETVTALRTSCTKTPSFAHFQSKNDGELTATASCYESPCQYPVTKSEEKILELVKTGQNSAFDTLSIPGRYPISEVFAAGLRHIRTHLGHYWTESDAFLHTSASL